MSDFSHFAKTIVEHKYAQELPGGGKETWDDISRRVATEVMSPHFPSQYKELEGLIRERKFIPGGRYLYATGKKVHQVNNCLLLKVSDSREGWADLMRRATQGLMTGAGIGVVYSDLRQRGAKVNGMGGESTGPLALMQMVNEAGRHIMQGGSRRSAIWAGLKWDHEDIFDFISLKDWSQDIKDMKEKDFNFPARMDTTNISVILDDEFFSAFNSTTHPLHNHAVKVYWDVVNHMLTTGEPGFSINTGDDHDEVLRNACTELSSADDNDICNLGSINLARIESIEELEKTVDLATRFLLSGTMYSTLPYDEVEPIRTKNRRLGLGLMGLHEWLLVRGKPYGPDEELGRWLEVYADSTHAAHRASKELGISKSIKTRAVAPVGTISIIGETTSGIEPINSVAMKRRYLKGNTWHAQYIVDATAKRIIDRGVNPSSIEDAYALAGDVTRRLDFQAFVQRYVDHGISSTINLPAWGTPSNYEDTVADFGANIMEYLPKLRGITTYPDGARGGQPLNPVPYEEAIEREGVEFEEAGNERACVNGVCGV